MRARWISAVVIWLSPCLPLSPSPPLHASSEHITSPMYRDPDLPGPRLETVFPERAKALWLRALQRPEVDLRCRAADTIALAHRRGMKGLETTIPDLVAALDHAGEHPTVRLTVARALIALDARQAATKLLEQAESAGGALRELVEPALARWDYKPARAVWLKRLGDPKATRRALILAIRGLAAVHEAQAVDRLRALVLSGRSKASGEQDAGGAGKRAGVASLAHPSVLLEAAAALGALRDTGLEGDAEILAGEASARGVPARLAAVSLLRRHRAEAAVRLLQRLAQDREPTVAVAAGTRLLEIDPKLLAAALPSLLGSPDAAARLVAVEALRREPSAERVRLLSERLDDVHPDVRERARSSLHELAAKTGFREQILTDAMRVLSGRGWRGQEQAAMLLADLDHKPAAGRLVELLPSVRAEVAVAAGWGLRKLAVRDTLPRVLSYVESRLKGLRGGAPLPHMIDDQLSQLNQFLGREKFAKADDVLRGFVPMKDKYAPQARAAAVWALGLINEGKDMPGLVAALEARLNDTGGIPPEHYAVRRMAAVSLGRLRAKKALPSLRKFHQAGEGSTNPVSRACGWAVAQITGEAMPPPGTVRTVARDWFLSPQD